MLTESFQSIATATRQLLRNWGVMIVLAGALRFFDLGALSFRNDSGSQRWTGSSESGAGSRDAISLLRTAGRQRQPNSQSQRRAFIKRSAEEFLESDRGERAAYCSGSPLNLSAR